MELMFWFIYVCFAVGVGIALKSSWAKLNDDRLGKVMTFFWGFLFAPAFFTISIMTAALVYLKPKEEEKVLLTEAILKAAGYEIPST